MKLIENKHSKNSQLFILFVFAGSGALSVDNLIAKKDK